MIDGRHGHRVRIPFYEVGIDLNAWIASIFRMANLYSMVIILVTTHLNTFTLTMNAVFQVLPTIRCVTMRSPRDVHILTLLLWKTIFAIDENLQHSYRLSVEGLDITIPFTKVANVDGQPIPVPAVKRPDSETVRPRDLDSSEPPESRDDTSSVSSLGSLE
jgi:hypothetical protein